MCEIELEPCELSLFDRVMDAWGKHMNADEALCDEMVRILGGDPADVDTWPLDDTGWDWHDMSVELYGVRAGLLLTPEQLDRFWLTGFTVLYVNYSDETGRSYSKHRGYEPSVLREGQRKVPTPNERQLRAQAETIRGLEGEVVREKAMRLQLSDDSQRHLDQMIAQRTRAEAAEGERDRLREALVEWGSGTRVLVCANTSEHSNQDYHSLGCKCACSWCQKRERLHNLTPAGPEGEK